jgi:hypothetical protein
VGLGAVAGLPYPGATYTILQGVVRDEMVRFSINASEFWTDWCALLTPYWHGSGSWRCLQDYKTVSFASDGRPCVLDMENGPDIEVESAKCSLCRPPHSVCMCNQMGCGTSPENYEAMSSFFDLTFEPDRVLGTVAGGTYFTDVRLERVE